jgi:hypothetical protein
MKQTQKLLAILLVLGVLIGIAGPVLANQIQGKISAVRPDTSEFVLSEGFKDMTFRVDNGTKIFLNQREVKLADLRPGDEAAVTFTKQGRLLVATMVQAVRKK